MTNINLLLSMIQAYNSIAYAHNYVFGFEFEKNIYYVQTDEKYLDILLTLDRASRGAGMALRFKPTVKIKKLLFSMFNPTLLCSAEYFADCVENSKYNKGEIFEKMYTELNGQIWKKDNKNFTKDGDITINGIAYQIKFEKATFTNEKSLMNLIKRA